MFIIIMNSKGHVIQPISPGIQADHVLQEIYFPIFFQIFPGSDSEDVSSLPAVSCRQSWDKNGVF